LKKWVIAMPAIVARVKAKWNLMMKTQEPVSNLAQPRTTSQNRIPNM